MSAITTIEVKYLPSQMSPMGYCPAEIIITITPVERDKSLNARFAKIVKKEFKKRR
jgi:hypothetical protein